MLESRFILTDDKKVIDRKQHPDMWVNETRIAIESDNIVDVIEIDDLVKYKTKDSEDVHHLVVALQCDRDILYNYYVRDLIEILQIWKKKKYSEYKLVWRKLK